MQEKPSNLKRGLTLVTLFTLLTGAMVAWLGGTGNVFWIAADRPVLSRWLLPRYSPYSSAYVLPSSADDAVAGGAYIYVKTRHEQVRRFTAGWLLCWPMQP
jgi:hypothetical protein